MDINRNQRCRAIVKLRKILGKLDGKVICVLGLSFKPNTDDIRNAPAIEMIHLLENEGADAMILATGWNEFKQLNIAWIKSLMKQAVLIDGRNLYDPNVMIQLGFTNRGVGRGNVEES